MNHEVEILYSVFALVGLTFFVMLILGILRMGGLLTGRLKPEFYTLFRARADEEPDGLRAVARNFQNLLELPMLFYLGCTIAYVTGSTTELLIVLAWLFVALRLIHTVIHTTYNTQWHRTIAFVAGYFVLVAFWLALACEIV